MSSKIHGLIFTEIVLNLYQFGKNWYCYLVESLDPWIWYISPIFHLSGFIVSTSKHNTYQLGKIAQDIFYQMEIIVTLDRMVFCSYLL